MGAVSSLTLYVFVVIVSSAFAFSSQRIRVCENMSRQITTSFKIFPYLIAFFIPWFIISFTNTGVDYNNYYHIIAEKITWENYTLFTDLEHGFSIISLFLMSIFHNGHIVIFIYKTFAILMAYYSFYLYKDQIRIGYSVLAYLCLFYLPSFYLISMSVSVSLALLSYVLYERKNRIIMSVLMLIIAAQFHNSAYIFLLCFVAMLMIDKKAKYAKVYLGVLSMLYVFAFAFSKQIYEVATTISGFHYLYEANLSASIGLFIFVIYIPLFAIVYLLSSKGLTGRLKNHIFIYSISSMLFYALGYKFGIIQRLEFYILPLYTFMFSEVVSKDGLAFNKNKRKIYITSSGVLIFLYFLFRTYLVFSERFTDASGLTSYEFFNPFVS